MKIKSLPALALLVISATSAATAENVVALNARGKLRSIPREVLAPPKAQAELSILRVDQRVEEGTVRFVVSMDRSLPPGRILVLYLDLGDEFV